MELIASVSYKCRDIAFAILAVSSPVIMVYPVAASTNATASAESTSYVFFASGSEHSTMSGSPDDMRRAQSLRLGSEGLLYVRDEGATYLIRDAATLRQAEKIFEPQKTVGAQQGELGSRQSELGRQQGELGAEQGRLGRQQAGATPGRASELARQQAAVGRRQSDLGRQQSELGKEQAALGYEQARLARLAATKLRSLLADAVQRGVAQRLD